MDQPETLMIEISKNNLDFYNDYLVALGQKKRIVVRRDLESKESEWEKYLIDYLIIMFIILLLLLHFVIMLKFIIIISALYYSSKLRC